MPRPFTEAGVVARSAPEAGRDVRERTEPLMVSIKAYALQQSECRGLEK